MMTAARTVQTGHAMPLPGKAMRAATGFAMPRLPKFIAKPLDRMVALTLCAIGIMGAVALTTWTISDPSLTFANGQEADNWLGFWGASFADLSMQFFGFAAPVTALVPLCWGLLKLTSRRLGSMRSRTFFWLVALLLIAAAAGCIVPPRGWPLEVGLGGVMGDAVLSIPRAFTGVYPQGVFALILGLLFFVPGGWLLLRACNLHNGLPQKAAAAEEAEAVEWGEDEEQLENRRDWSALFALPLGLAMHLYYSAKSLIIARRERRASTDFAASGHDPGASRTANRPTKPRHRV